MQSSPELEQQEVPPISSAAPVDDIVAALRELDVLQGMRDEDYLWLAKHGRESKFPPGAMMFREGDPPDAMNIMLRGEVHVRRQQSGNISFFIARMGQISGILPFSRMKGYGGTGFAVGDVWSLDIPKELFPQMLAAIPSMAQRCVSILLSRVREVTRMEMQAEKLTALGKLAANLAHELNNPASAAQRSAASLFGELREFGDKKQKLGVALAEEGQFQIYQEWVARTRERMANFNSRAILPDNPLDLSDREDMFRNWLESHNAPDAWSIASVVAESPLTIAHLEELAAKVSPKALTVSVAAFAASLNVERMAEVVLNSTVRIFDLISAIKDYSYMDQAPIQEIDIHQSLDTTLPRISAYGSELNQVWTELISNALEAMAIDAPDGKAHGTLRLRTSHSAETVNVEFWNTGPGIPPEIVSRIFEPFFTTKPPGKGLGLGLDAVNRIVSRHSGGVTVESKPGSTCFQVRLPIERAGAY
jgi:signal transduction histidine kinase